jgi:omega-amidase
MKLTVSLAQIFVARSEPDKNLEKGEALIAEAARRGSDLICFPEMWTTGFNWATNERVAHDHEKIVERVGEMAKRYGIWINGSMLSLNLFSFLHEDEHMAPGRALFVVDTPWCLVGLAICYDIRFPELFRTYALKGVGLVLSPMAFPHPRLQHWKVLVRARAIENQMYVIGTNQVGTEDFGQDGIVTYFGYSTMVDPWGETIIEASETEEMLLTATMDIGRVNEVRSKMRVLTDRRPDLYDL